MNEQTSKPWAKHLLIKKSMKEKPEELSRGLLIEMKTSVLPEHSWPQPSYGVQTLVSFREKHKSDEVTCFLQHHKHHYGQGRPVKARFCF
jgi:hypothetical protein